MDSLFSLQKSKNRTTVWFQSLKASYDFNSSFINFTPPFFIFVIIIDLRIFPLIYGCFIKIIKKLIVDRNQSVA